MIFYLIGVDYKTAPVDVREGLYRKRKEINEYLNAGNLKDAVILYTCNRIELYAAAGDLLELDASIKLFRRRFNEFSTHGYIILGRKNVFRHLLRLAIGLESQVKGEIQILEQLRSWHLNGSFPDPLSPLVYNAISLAEGIRIRSGLTNQKNNIANLVFRDISRRIGAKRPLKIVIVGTGKVAGLFAQHNGYKSRLYFAAHKNYLKAKYLAKRSQGKALKLEELPQALLKIDALISATSSPHFLFDKNYFSKIANWRDNPLYLYDLAMPRDINPDVNNLKGIVLNDPDTLTNIFNEDNKILHTNLLLAEQIIEEPVKYHEEMSGEQDSKDGYAAELVSFKTS